MKMRDSPKGDFDALNRAFLLGEDCRVLSPVPVSGDALLS